MLVGGRILQYGTNMDSPLVSESVHSNKRLVISKGEVGKIGDKMGDRSKPLQPGLPYGDVAKLHLEIRDNRD